MIQFEPINIVDEKYQLQELTFKDLIRVSVIHKDCNEARMTSFLNAVLQQDTQHMPLPKRYFLFLNYLKQQTATMLQIDVDVNKFILKNDYIDQLTKNGVTIRHLTGYEAEYIEKNCKSILESLGFCLAMKLTIDKHQYLHTPLDSKDSEYESKFIARLEYIKQLPGSDFSALYQIYSELDSDLVSLVDIVTTNSGFALRGADDALIRFRPSTAFIQAWRQLDDIYNGSSV